LNKEIKSGSVEGEGEGQPKREEEREVRSERKETAYPLSFLSKWSPVRSQTGIPFEDSKTML